MTTKLQQYRSEILRELPFVNSRNDAQKDIYIVVHDQYEYVKYCIESIEKNTENYHIWVYDNASEEQTRDYLLSLVSERRIGGSAGRQNLGFIKPNNYLARSCGSAPYMIFLNSDTEVKSGWDLAMINYLETNRMSQVGYSGGKLQSDGKGGAQAVYGENIDYVCGWCFCISRETYDRHGLFDSKNLEFAYGEDSDFSLRLREAGEKIYSLHLDLVVHFGNKTIAEVHREMGNYIKETFEKNHSYIRRRWSKYLN